MKSKSNNETKPSVHRVPPPISKRHGNTSFQKGPFLKYSKSFQSRKHIGEFNDTLHTKDQGSTDNNYCEVLFTKLDPNDEIHSNRIQQRRKQITMGKNTAGYEWYRQQVPKESRKIRCMDTPATPDHTLDIPTKRWTGIVRAW